MDRIRAKGFTDNVADLMAAKMSRLSDTTQDALGLLACVGGVAEIATLNLVSRGLEEATQAALWQAAHAGLVVRQGNAYAFIQDRVQEAACAIPEGDRAIRICDWPIATADDGRRTGGKHSDT
jgi:predicted ATPase